MKQFSAALILLLALGPLRADGISNSAVKVGQDGIYNPNTGSGTLWVLPGATTDCYWSKSLFFGNCALTVFRTTTNGTSTVSDSLGNWSQVANNLARVGAGNGLLVEEARTNGIRNNSMQGAVAGTPGTPPTNWGLSTPQVGLTRVIGPLFIESGLAGIEISYSGTSSGTAVSLDADQAAGIPATYGQTWTFSGFLYQVSASNVTAINAVISERNSGGTGVATNTSANLVLGSGPLGLARFSFTATLTNAATASIIPRINVSVTNGVAVSFDLKYATPQIENNFLINSAVASGAQTISNSGTSTCASGTYTVVGGTGTAATLTGVATAGVITSLTQLTPGSYTVFPPSPAALTGTGCSGSPTVTLTPANNAAQGFASSPIVTTTAAGVRGADVVTLTTPPTFGSSFSQYVNATPQAPTTYSIIQQPLMLDSGSSNNRFVLRRNNNTGLFFWVLTSGGVTAFNASATAQTWAQNTPAKFAASTTAGSQQASVNGTAATGQTAVASPVGVNTVRVGYDLTGSAQFNGYIARIALWPTTALPSASLQTITSP